MDSVQSYLQHLYGRLMEALPEAVPILRRFIIMTATRG
jgi:hypothetical protein